LNNRQNIAARCCARLRAVWLAVRVAWGRLKDKPP
jgi:hypothetical protein